MRQIVLASKNIGKIAEFERLLTQYAADIKVLGLAEFPNMPEVAEVGTSLRRRQFHPLLSCRRSLMTVAYLLMR
jgi:inosine/xanthosine triphosphate pyrophosphatase family protein